MPISLRHLFAGTAILFLGGAVYLLTQMNMLPVMAGMVVMVAMTMLALHGTETAFLSLIAFSILVPMDLAFKVGDLPRIGPTRMLMAAFLLGVLLKYMFYGRLHPDGRAAWPLKLSAGLYLAAATLSTFLSIAPVVSLNALLGREFTEQIVIFYLLVYYLRLPGFWDRLKKVLFVCTAVVCLLSFIEAAAQYHPLVEIFPEWNPEYRAGAIRVRSTFFHPLALSCFINLMFAPALVEFLGARQTDRRVYMGVLLLMMAACSFLTISRAPWMMLALQTTMILFYYYRGDFGRISTFFFIMGIAAALAVFAYQTNDTVYKLFRPLLAPGKVVEGSPEQYRLLLVETILSNLVGLRWIYGFGPNVFFAAGVEAEYSTHTRFLTAPDNHYARLLFEYGSAGLLCFSFLLLVSVLAAYRAFRRAPSEDKLLVYGMMWAMISFDLVNWTVSMFPQYPLGMFYWLLAAVAYTAGSVPRAEQTE